MHCGAKLIFVDHEYKRLVSDVKARIIVCNDTGRTGDPYEDFLTAGRAFSEEKCWAGLEMDSDENKPLSLNYTYVPRNCSIPHAFLTLPEDRVPRDG